MDNKNTQINIMTSLVLKPDISQTEMKNYDGNFGKFLVSDSEVHVKIKFGLMDEQ